MPEILADQLILCLTGRLEDKVLCVPGLKPTIRARVRADCSGVIEVSRPSRYRGPVRVGTKGIEVRCLGRTESRNGCLSSERLIVSTLDLGVRRVMGSSKKIFAIVGVRREIPVVES